MLRRGIDIRYVVTSLPDRDAEHIYATVYCARGQAENITSELCGRLGDEVDQAAW